MYSPNEQLKKYVQCYWVLDNITTQNSILTQKIISDGSNGLIFNIASPISLTISETEISNLSDVFITGATAKPTYLTINNKTKLIGIRFNIGGSYPFFDENLNNYIDTARSVDNTNFNNILKNIRDITNIDNIIKILDNFLIDSIIEEKIEKSDFILEVIKSIFQNNNLTKDELCQNFNISQRQLERRFKEVVGLSIKQILSIIKIHNSRQTIRNNDFSTLTQVGYNSNYCDQSHFIKEFKKFTDTTPKKYYKEKISLS